MRIKWILITVFILTLVPFHTFAQGDSPSAAVMKFEKSRTIDAEFAETISSIVRNEAQQIEKFDVVNKLPIEFQDILLALDCSIDDNACLVQAAKQIGARILVYGSISDTKEGIRISVNVFDSKTQKMTKSLLRTFDKKKDPVVAFRKEVQSFFGTGIKVKTRVQVGSNIKGSRVFFDDKFIGKIPLERNALKPGTYRIKVEAEGFQSWETRIQLKKGNDIEVWAKLQPVVGVSTAVKDPVINKKTTDLKKAGKIIEEPAESSTLNWGALTVTGVGAGVVAASFYYGLKVRQIENTIEDERKNDLLTRARHKELDEEGKKAEQIHFILLGSGAAIGTVGLLWFALSPTYGDNDDQAIRINLSPKHISATLKF